MDHKPIKIFKQPEGDRRLKASLLGMPQSLIISAQSIEYEYGKLRNATKAVIFKGDNNLYEIKFFDTNENELYKNTSRSLSAIIKRAELRQNIKPEDWQDITTPSKNKSQEKNLPVRKIINFPVLNFVVSRQRIR